MTMARITVVNDNPEFLDLVHDILEDDRYEATTIDGDRQDALELIRASRPDLLMIDIRMGTETLHGWRLAQELRRDPRFDELPVLVCSGDLAALEEIADDLDEKRHIRTLAKPFSIDELTQAVDELLADAVAG
jgi:CheY-like chemotaxis protein